GYLLVGRQSGHIQAVGLDLYVKLLEQSILELKGEARPEQARATLNLRVDLRIPEEYVPEVHQRMALYKRASQVRSTTEIQALRDEVRDRYGALPPQVEALLGYARLRLRAETVGVVQADLAGSALHLRFAPTIPISPDPLARRSGRAAQRVRASRLEPGAARRVTAGPHGPRGPARARPGGACGGAGGAGAGAGVGEEHARAGGDGGAEAPRRRGPVG